MDLVDLYPNKNGFLFRNNIKILNIIISINPINNTNSNKVITMDLDWSRIIEKPDAKHKVDGTILLKYRSMTEKLNNEVDSLKKKNTELEKQAEAQKATIKKLENDVREQLQSTESLENELRSIVTEKEKEYEAQLESIQNELRAAKEELESVRQQSSGTQQKHVELEGLLSEKTAKVAELEGQNQELSKNISEIEANAGVMDELKDNLAQAQKAVDEKNAEVTGLNSQIEELKQQQDQLKAEMETKLKTQVDSLNQQHIKEMEEQKNSYEQQIKELEGTHGMSLAALAKAEKDLISGTIYLHYTGSDFVIVRHKPEEGLALILDKQEEKWLMVWDSNTGFVERRSAERVARSIAKSGWSLPSGARVGFGFELEMQGEQSVPDRLRRDQHEYMD